MKIKACSWFILVTLLFMILSECSQSSSETPATLVNTAHLDHLYQEIVLDSLPAALIYIYADHPDYHWVAAEGEGIACVDDVARAAVFYLRHYAYFQEEASLRKARKLLQFVLDMQAENGQFYNFVYEDLSINKTRHNSRARADWWTWRALWALAEGNSVYQTIDPGFARQLSESIEKTLPTIDSLLQHYPEATYYQEFIQPDWLPLGGAADQSAVLLLGLIPYYHTTKDSGTAGRIAKFCEALIKMQLGDSSHFPYGLLLTWQNTWHAWGNSQADVLLQAGNLLRRDRFIEGGLREVKYFYPYWQENGLFRQIVISREGEEFRTDRMEKFDQIAYNIRPMVMASLKAYEVTGNKNFATQAGQIACWFLGKNAARQQMYDPATGRCFDGIMSADRINKNSGAESTIEALMTILAVEQNPIARKVFYDYYRKQRG